mmetsp:Transcript_8452/g.13915  ORF Transcript_8452/g.13915 Transcript_8452/m.13915 type:complete len:204 (+) Transcript_8452:94-705(+)
MFSTHFAVPSPHLLLAWAECQYKRTLLFAEQKRCPRHCVQAIKSQSKRTRNTEVRGMGVVAPLQRPVPFPEAQIAGEGGRATTAHCKAGVTTLLFRAVCWSDCQTILRLPSVCTPTSKHPFQTPPVAPGGSPICQLFCTAPPKYLRVTHCTHRDDVSVMGKAIKGPPNKLCNGVPEGCQTARNTWGLGGSDGGAEWVRYCCMP